MGNRITTVFVPLGYALTLTTDEFSAGTYVRTDPGGTRYTPDSIAASTTVVLGPFNEPRDYKIAIDGNEVTNSLAFSGMYTDTDESDNLTEEEVADIVGAMVTNNTETGITVTYQDADNTLDFVLTNPALTNAGTVNTGSTAVESGEAIHHKTTLTVASTLPAIAGGADLSVGKLLYTFPAGAIVVHAAYMSMAITQTEAHINADTPDIGIGTTIGSGANALLSDVGAGAENILTGQTANNCTGTAEVKTVADQVLVIEAGDPHTVYFNVADGWAASGDAAAIIAGTVVIDWAFIK